MKNSETMLIHILKIIKNNLRANLLLVAGIFVIATSLWYAVDYVYAVAVNGQMVPKTEYDATALHDGDTVLVIKAFYGG